MKLNDVITNINALDGNIIVFQKQLSKDLDVRLFFGDEAEKGVLLQIKGCTNTF